MVTRARKLSEESKEKTVLPSLDSTDWRGTARSLKVFHHNLLKKTTKVCYIVVANAKHQQQTMDINYGLFSSFQNISDKNREEYDLKKHQGQHIWKGNRLHVTVGKNKPGILTFSRRRQNRLNGVLDETRTTRTRVWASCGHASLCKFTSGSRRNLFRPRILTHSLLEILPKNAFWS